MSKAIGILTGGGDCPGLNAVIRGVTKSAINRYGYKVYGFYDSFLGMVERRYEALDENKVSGIISLGGTILGSTNKADPFNLPLEGGICKDCSGMCMELYHELGLDALICVGGDGTLTIAGKMSELGANVVGVPKTIDNDLYETDTTFGFDSALTTAVEAIDKLRTTADAHHRVIVVEVMGRNAGWLALEAGIAGGVAAILIPEIPYDIEMVAEAIMRRNRSGKRFSIVVVAEGAVPRGGGQVYQEDKGLTPENEHHLGGVGDVVAHEIEALTGADTRVAVLGHLQRGGSPSARDRVLSTQFATNAVRLCAEGNFNQMVALRGVDIVSVPIVNVMGKQRKIPLDSDLLISADAVGTCLGNRL